MKELLQPTQGERGAEATIAEISRLVQEEVVPIINQMQEPMSKPLPDIIFGPSKIGHESKG